MFYSEDRYLGNVIDPLSLNWYNYGKSNPLSYQDPSGHMPLYIAINALSAAMFESANPPTGAAANWREKLVMNFEPTSSYKWDKPANR